VKFRVGRDALGEAVAWVARALPSRPVVPVLSGLLLRAGDDGLTLSCFDYEVSARIAVEAEVAEPGTVLVPGRLLAEITRSLPQAPAEFSSVADMVSLTCGSAEFTLVALPADEYPALPEPPRAAGTVDGGVLAGAAAQVVPSASRDDTLPMLTGVCLDIDGESMTLAATDRYRLAVSEVSWAPAAPGIRAAALVPARTLADVARTMTSGEPVTISLGTGDPAGPQSEAEPGRTAGQAGDGRRPVEGMITFDGGGRRLTARLIAGEFIRYRSRFPAEFGCRAELAAGPFIEAIRRVSLVAERASPVRLEFGPGRVVIEAHAEGRARAVESVVAEFSGDEPVISFNPGYLLDGVTAAALTGAARRPGNAAEPGAGTGAGLAPESGRIRIEFTSPTKPALITWAAETDAAETEAAETEAGGSAIGGSAAGGGGAVGATGNPAFRYLVVPLRALVRS
jgi:DNA polymerase-3 subunit beta